MKFDFETVLDRSNTGSLKWDLYKGRDILPMWVADMDFAAPPVVLKALHQRIDHGVFGYTTASKALMETLIQRIYTLYHWSVDPDWIVWLPGLVTGLNLACRSVGCPGDEVILFTPIYPPFLSAPTLSARSIVRVPLSVGPKGHTMDPDRFKASLTDQTKLLLLCSPHNPVGRSYTPDELLQIARISIDNGLIVCSDEIHCDLILDSKPHVPTASLDKDIEVRSITLMSASKTFNLPGLSCSFAIIPDPLLRSRFLAAKEGIVPYVNTLGYEATLAAYQAGEPWRMALLSRLRTNRDLLEGTIAALSGLSMRPVEATYLAWIDARPLGLDDPVRFFEQAGVGLSDGREFDGEGFVRLNFGCPMALLQKGLSRITRAIESLKR